MFSLDVSTMCDPVKNIIVFAHDERIFVSVMVKKFYCVALLHFCGQFICMIHLRDF